MPQPLDYLVKENIKKTEALEAKVLKLETTLEVLKRIFEWSDSPPLSWMQSQIDLGPFIEVKVMDYGVREVLNLRHDEHPKVEVSAEEFKILTGKDWPEVTE